MRATQYVRRGLIAFAAVATLSAGFAGIAKADAAIEPNGSAVVWSPIPGYSYDVIHAPGGDLAGILAIGGPAATNPVAVRFMPDINGAAVMNITSPDVVAERQ
ncbi:MAG: hypothetical protein IT338_19500 [Thermomicrobiales bacterium]|nr:hypothetical protein [Thermomicrobiales bacterium]